MTAPDYPHTPQLDKMIAVKLLTRPAGEFLEWLQRMGYILVSYDHDAGEVTTRVPPTDELLAAWQDIDLDAVEQERAAVLDWVRRGQS